MSPDGSPAPSGLPGGAGRALPETGMAPTLSVCLGQASDRGRKAENQDFHGAILPDGTVLALKGVALALADGISSSRVSRVAAETAVRSFLDDYYCSPETWEVKTAARTVLTAANAWLHAQSPSGQFGADPNRGHVCTFSGLILKGRRGYVFHVGDSRIWRVAGASLEQLTEDHRIALPGGESYLGRALGLAPQVEIDQRVIELAPGDTFLLTTDGVHEPLGPGTMARIVAEAGEPEAAASALVAAALAAGSEDNLTAQVVRIEALPDGSAEEFMGAAARLPLPPPVEAPAEFDGYRLLRQIHGNARSRIFVAVETATGRQVALKLPAPELREDPAHLRRMMMEEWIARRLSSPHVLKAVPPARPRRYLYVVTEHVEGRTLRQWMHDNPQPDLAAVRDIAGQIARGIRAFHRRGMVHQDLRPENVMIDRTGTVKLIDFGSVRIAGVAETVVQPEAAEVLGAVQYVAPELFLGAAGSWRSDLYALGVIVYEMLTGRLPYGAAAARARSRAAQRRLVYASAQRGARPVPEWMDAALRRAVDPDPRRRQEALSEFVADLSRPDRRHAGAPRPPLAERDPVRFWQIVSLCLAGVIVYLLAR